MSRQGQIQKRDNGKYLARVYAGKGNDGSGHWVSKTSEKKNEAEAWLSKQLTDKALGTFRLPSQETLASFLENWLTDVVRFRVQERTFDDYTRLVNKYIFPNLGHVKVSDPKPDHIQHFYTTLAEEHGNDTPRHVHCVLHSALNQAVAWNLVPRNVSSRELVHVPRVPRFEPRPLLENELERFYEEAEGDRYYALFVFLIDSGLRPGESLALTWKDIDLETGLVLVTKALSTGRTKFYHDRPKTLSSQRSVGISDVTLVVMQEHKEMLAKERMNAGDAWEDRNLVSPNEIGGYSDGTKISRNHFKPILCKAGLPSNIRLYDLRHTCATLLLGADVHPKKAAEQSKSGYSTP